MSIVLSLLALAAAQDAPVAMRPAAPPLLERFVVDPARSEVGFDAKSTLHDFTGRTRDVRGDVRAVFGPSPLVAGRIVAGAASLDTGNTDRDEKMLLHLATGEFPELAFRIDAVRGALRAGAGTLQVDGHFSIHGVEKARTLELDVKPEADGALRATGRLAFPMSDHGINPPQVVVVTVTDRVEAWLDLVLVPVAGPTTAARVHAIERTETLTPTGGTARVSRGSEALYVAEQGMLWDRGELGEWVSAGDDGPVTWNWRDDVVRGKGNAAERAFREAQERLASLESKLDGLSGAKRAKVQQLVDELRSALALAPAAGPLVAERMSGDAQGTHWKLGDTLWLSAQGRVGDADFAPLLAALEGLPGAVREALSTLEAVPREIEIRSVEAGGARVLKLVFSEPTSVEVPTWVFDHRSVGANTGSTAEASR